MRSLNTLRIKRTLAVGCATLFAAIALATLPCAARADGFGSVDLGKIESGYTKKADIDKGIQALAQGLENAINVQKASDMLNTAQQKQLSDLLTKPTQTDADRAAIANLQTQSRNDANALVTLQQKQDLSDTEKAQLSALTKEQQDGRAAIEAVNTDYTARMQDASNKANQQFLDQVKQAVAEVAKEHSLSVVFDSAVALWTANDITDEVLKRLNK